MGADLSQFSPEQIEKLKQETPFTEEEMILHLKRYAKYDKSDRGTAGIPLETIQNFPEFVGNPFINRMLLRHIDKEKQVIFAEQFLYFCGKLSPKTNLSVKKKFAFELFDVNKMKTLQHEELFKFYKLIYPPGSLTDDQILDMVFRALSSDELKYPGKLTFEDFNKVISDGAIRHRFTVELHLDE